MQEQLEERLFLTGMPPGIISYPRIRITLNGVPVEIRVTEEEYKKLQEAGMWEHT